MRKKYLKVVISGLPQSGKTILSELIGDTLASHGFDVLMETDEEDYAEWQQKAAVTALAESGIQVIVQERDVQKSPPRKSKPKPKQRPEKDHFSGEDETLLCKTCKKDFIFPVHEQEFFKDKGLDKAPIRCHECRSRKRRSKNHADVAQR